MNPTIKMIKTYQSIRFAKNEQQSFTASEFLQAGEMKPRVSFVETDRGVVVHNATDAVLVGWANIAYVQYDVESFKALQPKAEVKVAKAK